MPGIFICYRREDSAGYAGRLYDRLAAHFGKNTVFMDVDDIRPGVNFTDTIQEVIARSRAVVVVIGKQWLSGGDPFGRRRLGDADDPVRHEIRSALQRQGVRVIPVLVHGATMPAQYDLPEEVRDLTRRHAVELRHPTWSNDVRRLIRALEEVVDRPGRTQSSQKRRAPTGKGTKKRAARPPAPPAGAEPGAVKPAKKPSAERAAPPEAGAGRKRKRKKSVSAPAPKAGAGGVEGTPPAGSAPAAGRKPAAKKRPRPKGEAATAAAGKKTARPGAAGRRKAPGGPAGGTKRPRKRPG